MAARPLSLSVRKDPGRLPSRHEARLKAAVWWWLGKDLLQSKSIWMDKNMGKGMGEEEVEKGMKKRWKI